MKIKFAKGGQHCSFGIISVGYNFRNSPSQFAKQWLWLQLNSSYKATYKGQLITSCWVNTKLELGHWIFYSSRVHFCDKSFFMKNDDFHSGNRNYTKKQ